MTVLPTISFAKISAPKKGTAVLLVAKGGTPPAIASEIDPSGVLARAIEVSKFEGKAKSVVDIVAPAGSALDRILVVGVGDAGNAKESDWAALGGVVRSRTASEKNLTVIVDCAGAEIAPIFSTARKCIMLQPLLCEILLKPVRVYRQAAINHARLL